MKLIFSCFYSSINTDRIILLVYANKIIKGNERIKNYMEEDVSFTNMINVR